MSIVKISISDAPQICEVGKSCKFQFSVSNASGKPLRYGSEIRLDDNSCDWVDIDGKLEGDLPEDMDTTISVIASPSKERVSLENGEVEYTFRLRIYDVSNPSDSVDSRTVTVKVKPTEKPPVPTPDRKIWPWIVAAVSVVVIAVAVFFIVKPDKVPNLVGQQWLDIEEQLDDFDVSIATGYVIGGKFIEHREDDYAQGTVYQQTPQGGASVPESSDDEAPPLTLLLIFPPVSVPDFVGKKLGDVEVELSQLNLESGSITYKAVSADQEGSPVLEQEPAGGTEVIPGSKINFVVAEKVIQLPNMFGYTLSEARQHLKNLGLKNKISNRAPGGHSVGTILNSVPPATSKVKPGDTVTLIVAAGPVKVPNVVGRKIIDATKILKGLGFAVSKKAVSKPRPSLNVIAQSRRANTQAPFGSTIQLTYEERAFAVRIPQQPVRIDLKSLDRIQDLQEIQKIQKK